MNVNRRRFCSVVAVGSTPIISNSVSAQSEIPITGDISSSAGADLGGVTLFFQQVDSNSVWTYTVPESGDIDFTVSEAGTYRVRLFNTSSRNDNVPLLYSFGEKDITETGSSFSFTVPESHATKIRCVDTSGDPVQGLSVTLRAGGTSSPTQFTTSEQGFVTFFDTPTTELQLSGPTGVEVDSSDGAGSQRLGTIDVIEPSEVELIVENPETYSSNFEIIEADPDAGFHYPYLLYRPDASRSFERPLFVQPHNSEPATSQRELINQLINTSKGGLFAVARENNYPGLIPGFPRTPNDGPDTIQTLALPTYKSELLDENYQLEDIATEEFPVETFKRLDKQLLAMIDHAKSQLEDEPYPVADQIHMNGFSGSSSFSHRFAFLNPDKVRTVTAGGNGVYPLPKDAHDGRSLRYPLGTADYQELTGKEFDQDAWAEINRYIYIGEEDQPLPETDSTGYYNTIRYPGTVEAVYGMNRVTERIPFVKSEYSTVTDNAEFKVYSGIGHSVDKRIIDDIVDYHRQHSPTPDPAAIQEDDQSETSDSKTSESTPGFGIGSGITALGAAGYMLKRRFEKDSD